jgi:hypothetical protein
MVIEDRQWITAPGRSVGEWEMSLEIHLPEQIGSQMPKSPERKKALQMKRFSFGPGSAY